MGKRSLNDRGSFKRYQQSRPDTMQIVALGPEGSRVGEVISTFSA
jgi:hypothetical protein